MSLIGELVKLDVDKDGKASGAFLRPRVSVELSKLLRRGILLKPERSSKPEWFDIQYDKLPFTVLPVVFLAMLKLNVKIL